MVLRTTVNNQNINKQILNLCQTHRLDIVCALRALRAGLSRPIVVPVRNAIFLQKGLNCHLTTTQGLKGL